MKFRIVFLLCLILVFIANVFDAQTTYTHRDDIIREKGTPDRSDSLSITYFYDAIAGRKDIPLVLTRYYFDKKDGTLKFIQFKALKFYVQLRLKEMLGDTIKEFEDGVIYHNDKYGFAYREFGKGKYAFMCIFNIKGFDFDKLRPLFHTFKGSEKYKQK